MSECNLKHVQDFTLTTGTDYQAKFGEVLKYYEERGSLVDFTVTSEETLKSVGERLSHEVLSSIKL